MTQVAEEEGAGRRRWVRRLFYAVGWFAIALQGVNFYLFMSLIGK